MVPPQELHTKHLAAEYREIVRVFALVRNRLAKPNHSMVDIPKEYVLGDGHVKFFFDKLQYVLTRYKRLAKEMRRRGYRPNPVPQRELTAGIDTRFFGKYRPTTKAIEINRERIRSRLPNR